jgi:hypothetical protein
MTKAGGNAGFLFFGAMLRRVGTTAVVLRERRDPYRVIYR